MFRGGFSSNICCEFDGLIAFLSRASDLRWLLELLMVSSYALVLLAPFTMSILFFLFPSRKRIFY